MTPVPPMVPVPSLDDVYRQHHAFVWRTLRRTGLAEDAVWDAVQDVFLIVARKLHTFEGRASLRTWLFRIAIRVASGVRRDHRRAKWRRWQRAQGHAVERNGPSPSPDSRILLHTLLDELDDGKRCVFIMSELEGLTAREIADVLEIKIPTVYSRLRLAKQQLAKLLARDESRGKKAWIRG